MSAPKVRRVTVDVPVPAPGVRGEPLAVTYRYLAQRASPFDGSGPALEAIADALEEGASHEDSHAGMQRRLEEAEARVTALEAVIAAVQRLEPVRPDPTPEESVAEAYRELMLVSGIDAGVVHVPPRRHPVRSLIHRVATSPVMYWVVALAVLIGVVVDAALSPAAVVVLPILVGLLIGGGCILYIERGLRR